MGYPFIDNPLDDYLTELRLLGIEQVLAYAATTDQELPLEDRRNASKNMKSIGEKISELSENLALSPRKFDVFLSGAELSVERFEKENPEPKSYSDCNHTEKELRVRTFRNGSLHVVSQCTNCGSQVRTHAKSEGWKDLPLFNEDLRGLTVGVHARWISEKYRIFYEAMREGDQIPTFSYSEFDSRYEQKHPKPVSPVNCDHVEKELRLRIYDSGGDAVVEQCKVCGKHIAGVAKKKVMGWSELPRFDEPLLTNSERSYLEWSRGRSQAREIARESFNIGIVEKINSGELSIKDNSTFGTYYTSPEWYSTRTRIIRRDDYKCQACGLPAECVHHILYDRLGRENDLDLISLCNRCHDEIHRKQIEFSIPFRLTPNEIKGLWQGEK